ncbi:uncharacterized protein LOC117171522 [Belonocnema kinseyi]|uniref:uncharacterized protein LOC117171522 n=1 Tax=Belonocnema kinseyi TaxID=2817044 RepID=UPI00143D4D76|nr:uncharacterized protein LOC117171522 [Belonocnema kinseyi]
MFKIFVLATLLTASNAYLNHGPSPLNHPNYGPYHGGYSVAEPGSAYQPNYLSQYRPHGPIPAYPRHPVPVQISAPVQVPAPVPIPAPVGGYQKLGHVGYGYAPVRHLPVVPAPVQHSVPIGLPQAQVHPNAYAHSGYSGAQANYGSSYVVAPSVTFSQNTPKQIAPVQVSNAVRIPYAYPAINKPQLVPHPAEVNHGW